ncbi:TetR/AcrR family transcriptional regulator [Lactococcus termiticola]|uniref:TetR family transcriptional regulator n=1 Tax=Lactococcus termiticola TaxID=2169526 RepID=A0A2R5HIV3_9LACT|nr:TetR/AcrR family transcriptional regulator [Lactococcus termiticola]GBG96310.1 TetR family transcriptional regulator [Lactococcus termiticola]
MPTKASKIRNREVKHSKTRNLLKEAMVELLEEKSFDSITTSELVAKAGVSRSSFYTHYQDKYDLIEAYQAELFSTITYIFTKNENEPEATLIEVYRFIDRNPIYAGLFSENGSKEIQQFFLSKLRQLFEQLILPARLDGRGIVASHQHYVSIYYANAIFGLTQAWIRDKKRESPEVLTALILQLIE